MTSSRLLLLLLLSALPLSAQTTGAQTSESNEESAETANTTDEENLKRFWQLSLPDGNFMVALDRIASISRSSYVLDGGLIVTEVTIDTVGNSLCRIYQIAPVGENSGASAAQRLGQRALDISKQTGAITGADLANMVQKVYPTTTHAKTVEFRVQDKSTLNALYGSLTQAWSQGKGRRFTLAN